MMWGKTLSRHCSIAFVEIVQQQLDQYSQVELLFLERISLSTKLRHVEAWLAAGSAVLPAEHRTGTLLTRVDTWQWHEQLLCYLSDRFEKLAAWACDTGTRLVWLIFAGCHVGGALPRGTVPVGAHRLTCWHELWTHFAVWLNDMFDNTLLIISFHSVLNVIRAQLLARQANLVVSSLRRSSDSCACHIVVGDPLPWVCALENFRGSSWHCQHCVALRTHGVTYQLVLTRTQVPS